MAALDIRSLIKESGELQIDGFHNRDRIYTGRNGNAVERITLIIGDETHSLIYKPLTNYASMGKEDWVYRNFLNKVPIRVPRLLAVSPSPAPEQYWLLYEDIGKLSHSFDFESMREAAMAIPKWSSLPLDSVPEHFSGHTPKLAEVREQLLAADLLALLKEAQLESREINLLLADLLQREVSGLFGETVICHGDYYPLNYSKSGQELIVLDWEYIHRNSEYWDMYSLMDITSPVYRRPVLDVETRLNLLSAHMAQRNRSNLRAGKDFVQGYHRFCALYSAWLLLLIDNDMKQRKFNLEALRSQQRETLAILKNVLSHLMEPEVKGN